uniref:SAM-dependent MTase RsmB/NOP-type domain-containing protein n=1 Tax=Zooxanthella nutricula TaxID=1333877 RepID=A0A7S2VFP2_9DINO
MNATRVRHLENALGLFDQMRRGETPYLPLDLFLRRYFQAHRFLDGTDRAWVAEKTYELHRWRGLLDHVTTPPHSWVNRMRTFFLSDRWRSQTQNPNLPHHVRCSFPKDLFSRFEASLGTKAALDVCGVLNEPAMTCLRVNTLKMSRDKVFSFLTARAVPVEKTLTSKVGLVLASKQKLLELPEYKLGYFEIQDESSQLIASQVDAKPGELVMDYCAGSGGKALCIAPPMLNQGHVWMHDPRDMKLFEAKRRMRKAGIRNYTLLPPAHPLLPKLRTKMDWVLVDAPCSQTGALRRNPDMKWAYTDERLWQWVSLQREIFEAGLKYLKDGGKIVYATCSTLDEENSQQVRFFCEKFGLYLSRPPLHALPQSRGMDGFFCATMERR